MAVLPKWLRKRGYQRSIDSFAVEFRSYGPSEQVCVLYQHPNRPDQPDYVWMMRRSLIPHWTKSLAKQGFRLVGIVRYKRGY